jgi:hypothetical protein
MSSDGRYRKVSHRHIGQDQPDPDTEPGPNAPHGFVKVWSAARPGLPLLVELMPGRHEGLHLTAQALLMLGDLAAALLTRQRR